MTNETHTPGPWKIDLRFPEGDASKPSICTDDENELVVCVLAKYTGHTNENARLIAAAPETARERDELKARIEKMLPDFDDLALKLRTAERKESAIKEELWASDEACRFMRLEKEKAEAQRDELIAVMSDFASDYDNKLEPDVEHLLNAIAKAEGRLP